MKPTLDQIKDFLYEVDTLFPVPLSQKQNLDDFAKKLYEKAKLCVVWENCRIIAMAAGYVDSVSDGLGYLSILATLPAAQGRGLALSLVRNFLKAAEEKGLRGVHLYAVPSNFPAIRLYEKLGFVPYIQPDESRPDDAHLIYHLKGSAE